ncbi:hypothetical protein OPV22_023246 [Ensete ventricosum]|uniref:Wall-associated receptor kinase galacturonan-binding domain-containing protein n=1 Tax=Ensete ventricosum TaxID=4639 RepID=A0AAV8QRK7_ENSVE|nr:hypothetical protein OPV22_023246 [Ensete ventricosum]
MERSSFSITAVSPLLLMLLLTTAELCSSHSNKSCSPSYCGHQRIRHPFRLRGDPPECGEPQSELVCEGKDAVLYHDSGKYFVTDISYWKQRCRLLYAGFVTGTCRLPPGVPFSHKDYMNSSTILYPDIGDNRGSFTNWGSFMNCTQEIQSPEYVAVPCLSGNNSTTYVVVESDAYELLYLKNSCSFITYLPVQGLLSTGMDIFELLREGFLVTWSLRSSNESIVKQCWTQTTWPYTDDDYIYGIISIYIKIQYFIDFEMDFLACIFNDESDRHHSHIIYSVALVLIILLDVALCLLVSTPIFAISYVAVFLAYNAWKMIAPVDSVEKFLRNQQTLSPTRFGMLLMEMAGGRRNVDPKADNSSQIYYPSWIYDQLAGEEWPREPRLDASREMDEMERKLCMVGLWCIQMKPCDRPSMSRVVEMLEGDVNDLRMPPKPFFSSTQPSLGRQSSCMPSSSTGLEIISEHHDLP